MKFYESSSFSLSPKKCLYEDNYDSNLHNRLTIIKVLLARTTIDLTRVYKNDDILLHAAVLGGNIELVKLLLERTIQDPTEKNQGNDTVLHSAVLGGDFEIVKLLLERTCIDPTEKNQDGDTLLHLAVQRKSIELVKLLLERTTIDPAEKNKDEEKHWTEAIRILHLRVIPPPLMLKITSMDGDTLLHLAAQGGNIELVKLLLERTNIDAEEKNKDEEEHWTEAIRILHIRVIPPPPYVKDYEYVDTCINH
ncbi:uncharacterized protein LOC143074132 [Mytilus galloprovincialis]|uniref:uncharacterized protein LOC143074132 n=1 Tax=Mytilus galloprovincialis TaxID=29158 RepID=UPI003F7B9E16